MINDKFLYKSAPFITENYLNKDGHKIYYQMLGNIAGKPLFIIHGGPGGANSEKSTRFFDPEKYLFILIDQRGCGKSTPHLETKNNTIDFLAQDIEEIRKINKLNKINIFAGSWGTTLALYYAIKYPNNVEKMLLRGIFLARVFDINWFVFGAKSLRPLEYKEFVADFEEDMDIVDKYYNIFNSNNELAIQKAALKWYNWENCLISVNNKKPLKKLNDNNKDKVIQIAFFENYYFKNNCFIKENFILDNIYKISHIPLIIIHGEYDLDCLPISAYELAQAHKNSQLIIVKKSAHCQWEVNIAKELIKQGKLI